MSPVRLYLLAAIPFFFVFSLSRDESVMDSAGVLELVVWLGYEEAVPRYEPLQPLPPDLVDDSTARAEWTARVQQRRDENRARWEAERQTLDAGFRRILELLPIVVGIIMVPLLAVLLSLGMRPKEGFVARLVFSLHLHTIGYALAVIGWLAGWQMALGLYGTTLYFGAARRRLKGEGIPMVAAAALLTLGGYFVGFLLVYVGFVQGLAWLAPGWVYAT